MSRVWKQCAAARGKTNEGGLSYVLVPSEEGADPTTWKGAWVKVDDQQEMRERISERLQQHFSQSKDCNLTSPPIDITMDFEGTCEKAEAILNGTHDFQEINEATEWLLDHLQYVVGCRDKVDYKLSAEEFEGKVKTWKERTSTSPATNVHLGHAKAYFALHPIDPELQEEEYEKFESMRSRILKGHLTLLNYALKFGYSYDRWQTVVNALLEKDPGIPKIHRLRVIHLYEWDFNLILAVKWRSLLHHMCDNRHVHPSLYGGVPGHTTLDPVFIREMEYELCRLLRHPMIHFDNDAKSCYDRIPCFLANVASRKYGMNAKVCIGDTWAAALATFFLKQWHDLWVTRNSDRHGNDQKTKAEAARRQAIREVVQLYDYKGAIEPHLNWILELPLEQRVQKRTYVLRAWISSFGPILKKSHEYQTRLETG